MKTTGSLPRMFRFQIHDVLWLTLVVRLLLAWAGPKKGKRRSARGHRPAGYKLHYEPRHSRCILKLTSKVLAIPLNDKFIQ